MSFFRSKYFVLILGVGIGFLLAFLGLYFYGRNSDLNTVHVDTNHSNVSDNSSAQHSPLKTQSNELNSSSISRHTKQDRDARIMKYGVVNDDEENISILKEELIAVKNIRVKCDADVSSSKSDSVLSEISGIQNRSGDFMMIEFWKTPLNSKGYKMSRNKLVLYGANVQDLDVVKLDNNFYLKNNNSAYRLEYSNEFKRMEAVTEREILARLN